ncbi:MAG TPA: PQQ-dependent sugar dehydrogenase [Baekduia sp.]|uniref:PQQ-dependent sugar dehydrogenase n=1 Tax=Baekduia sp. TaxID=2600305 RepID=UPI002D798696|nr:PQQ-dependent sugar dehydrogenase [Baekduia sp.]HET6507141.1 PQQ-dependent sugar dehydrogenase [Baekduia sp.]
MTRRFLSGVAAAVALIAAVAGCGQDEGAGGGATTAARPTAPAGPGTTAAVGSVEVIAQNLPAPWGLAFLPDGNALVGERDTGRIVEIPAGGGSAKIVMRIPGVVHDAGGEDGLLGLAVSPRYDVDKLVYAYYTTARDNRIVRFKLGGAIHPILTGLRKGVIHNGGRIAFGPDRKLYAGVGETGTPGLAQDMRSRNGKILRMDPDGSDVQIWSSGHRNVEGLAWDSAGRLWASEFGQDRWDELNLIHHGDNGGWPVVEGFGSTHGGKYTNPKLVWPTDEASPSGIAIVGNILYMGALRGQAVLRVRLDGTSARKLSPIVTGRGRIRTVVRAPDGSIWVTTSNTDGRGTPRPGDDKILRVQV